MKRVILRVMMLVAMASAAVTMSVHTSSKEVKASPFSDAFTSFELVCKHVEQEEKQRNAIVPNKKQFEQM